MLATPVTLWGGAPFFARAWASVVNRSPNMFTLIGLGTATAYGYSVAATVAPGWFPPAVRGHGGQGGVYFEVAAVITVLVLLGQVLELRARGRTNDALRALLSLAPATARVIRDGQREDDVPLEHVVVGDRLRVRPGERVPVDGFEFDHDGPDGAVLRNDRFELTVIRRPVAGPRPPIALTATWPDQPSPVVLATVTELSS